MEVAKKAIGFTEAINLAREYIAKHPNGVLHEIGYVDGHIQGTNGYKAISVYTGGGSGPKHMDFEKILNVEWAETATVDLSSLEMAIASIKKNMRINDQLVISFGGKISTICNRYGSSPDLKVTVDLVIPILFGTTVNLSMFMTVLKTFKAVKAEKLVVKFNSPLSMIVFATEDESVRVGLMPIQP